jgi:hypothetical protein
VFEETNIKLNEGDLVTDLFMPPENVQFYHVQNIRDHLAGVTHPSNGLTASHTVCWLWIKLLKYIKETCSNK